MGEPLAQYILDQGYRVVGVDAPPPMIALCRDRFPAAGWLVADMRELRLGRRFDGILAWDSFFHLSAADQHSMVPRFAAHARPGAASMFTSGSSEGEAIGSWCGEPFYHASLDPAEYGRLLVASGFSVRERMVDDPDCGGHTVWLATESGTA